MRSRALERQSPCALIQLRHVLQGYGTNECLAASKAKPLRKEQVLGTSNKESRINYRKILFLIRRPEVTPTDFFLDI